MSRDEGGDPNEAAENSSGDEKELVELPKADSIHTDYAAGFAFSISDNDVVLDFWQPNATFKTDPSNQVQSGERDPIVTTRIFMTKNTAAQLYHSLSAFVGEEQPGEEKSAEAGEKAEEETISEGGKEEQG